MPDNHASDYINRLESVLVAFARELDTTAAEREGLTPLLPNMSDDEILDDLFAWYREHLKQTA